MADRCWQIVAEQTDFRCWLAPDVLGQGKPQATLCMWRWILFFWKELWRTEDSEEKFSFVAGAERQWHRPKKRCLRKNGWQIVADAWRPHRGQRWLAGPMEMGEHAGVCITTNQRAHSSTFCNVSYANRNDTNSYTGMTDGQTIVGHWA